MRERQLDLFSERVEPLIHVQALPGARAAKPLVDRMTDSALIAAIPLAGMSDALALVAEAGTRKLVTAVPALENLCRRFTGFGPDRPIPEQVATLKALAEIGGSEACRAIERIVGRCVVQGPGLATAMTVAARLGANLSTDLVVGLLRHSDPQVRASAWRCVRSAPAVVPLLHDLVRDVDPDVRLAAACALGRSVARPELVRLLRETPSLEVIDAVTTLADEDCVVLLGRIARTLPDLQEAALDALEAIDQPRATQSLTEKGLSDLNGL